MNEEPLESPVPARQPVEEDVQSTEKNTEAETISEAAPAQEPSEPSELDTTEKPSSDPVQENPIHIKEEEKTIGGEPPVDWFEPLEDDDVDSVCRNDPEEESVAGESERSESMAGSEKAFKKIYQ